MSFFSSLRAELQERFDPWYFIFRRRYEKKIIDRFLENNPLKLQPKFSIILPTYGIPVRYLRECLSSIEKQSYTNWELCICDDADSLKVAADHIREYASRKSSKTHLVVHEKNLGICQATLDALSLATGDYLVFMDGDDVLHPKALECLAHAIDGDDIDFLYTDHDHMTDWGLRVKPMVKPGWSPELLLHVNYINHLTCVSLDLLKNHITEFFKSYMNGSQDWDLCLKMILYAKRIKHVPLILYHWRARPESMASNIMAKPWAVTSQIEVRRRLTPSLGEQVQFNRENMIYEGARKIKFHHYGIDEKISSLEVLKRVNSFLDLENSAEVLIFGVKGIDPQSLQGILPYALFSRVACVWPFRATGLRTGYTVSGEGVLSPLASSRSTFSSYSGNVLTGPLNGLVIEASKLKKIIDWLNANLTETEKKSLNGSQSVDALGAVIGLTALILGFRNMSSSNSTLEQGLDSLELSPSLVPLFDAYV